MNPGQKKKRVIKAWDNLDLIGCLKKCREDTAVSGGS